MGFNLVAVSVNYPFSDSLTHLREIMDTSVLLLNFLVLVVLTLLSLGSMLLIMTEGWCRQRCSNFMVNNSPRRGIGSSW